MVLCPCFYNQLETVYTSVTGDPTLKFMLTWTGQEIDRRLNRSLNVFIFANTSELSLFKLPRLTQRSVGPKQQRRLKR